MKVKDLFEAKKHDGLRSERPAHGNNYIYNPTIMDVEQGNMVRVHGHAKHANYERDDEYQGGWGQIVLDVDYKKGMVLVGEYQGGSKQFSEWVPVDEIDVTWNIGGYAAAKEKMAAFSSEMMDVLDRREQEINKEEDLDKYLLKRR